MNRKSHAISKLTVNNRNQSVKRVHIISSHYPKSFRPISLLPVTFKLMERLILNRITHIVEHILPKEQAGFRPGKCTTDQVCLLVNDIESAFQENKKAGAVFIDLSSAYDTVWHRGLLLKL